MAALPDTAMPPQDMGAQPMVQPNPQEVLDALLNAVKIAAMMGAGAEDTREITEGSKAALAYAQAWAILNPQLDPAGLPLDHHIQLEAVRGQNAVALERERGANQIAAAEHAAQVPQPVKSVNASSRS